MRLRNPETLFQRLRSNASPPLRAWMDAHEGQVVAALTRAKKRTAFHVVGREGSSAKASGKDAAHLYGGLTLAPGAWLYGQFPGSGSPDAIQLVREEDGSWQAKRHGGITPYHIAKHRLDDLRSPLVPGNYLNQLGYLEQVVPDPAQRAAFIARAREIPGREEAERQAEIARKQAHIDKHGPWFDTVARQEGNLGYVGAGWVLKGVLKKHGITVRTGQRHYSMASGIDFHYDKSDQARINAIFPGLARGGSAYPFATEDRSDSMSDYHSPGGFHVAPAYVEEVRRAIRDQIGKKEASVAKKAAKAPVAASVPVYASEWRPSDILVVGDGSKLWVYDVGVGVKGSAYIGSAMPYGGARVFSGKGIPAVQAPDLTFKKLQERGSKVLAAYLPAIKGRRVLLRGSGWYQTGPAGKYENYAHDITN